MGREEGGRVELSSHVPHNPPSASHTPLSVAGDGYDGVDAALECGPKRWKSGTWLGGRREEGVGGKGEREVARACFSFSRNLRTRRGFLFDLVFLFEGGWRFVVEGRDVRR